MKERLQKYIAKCGVCSRRKAEELIFSGLIKVNGEIVNQVVMIDENEDVVEYNGRVLKVQEEMVYIMLNKPTGIITSSKDQFNRKTVVDIIDLKERVFSVGRLDYDTSGLLILTNDGDFAYKLTHPSNEKTKTYRAYVKGHPTEEELEMFRSGLKIEDYVTSKAKVKIVKKDKNNSMLEIVIHEGRNRQVRKMCSAINHPVITLERIKIGEISLGGLKVGEYRNLTSDEVALLSN
ncbi:MAG: pseudouridine synthase [Clostridium sp.]